MQSSGSRGADAGGANGQSSRVISPDVAAREDLVRWCGEHQLPVPPPTPAAHRAPR